jgi:hypothetical protein
MWRTGQGQADASSVAAATPKVLGEFAEGWPLVLSQIQRQKKKMPSRVHPASGVSGSEGMATAI